MFEYMRNRASSGDPPRACRLICGSFETESKQHMIYRIIQIFVESVFVHSAKSALCKLEVKITAAEERATKYSAEDEMNHVWA